MIRIIERPARAPCLLFSLFLSLTGCDGTDTGNQDMAMLLPETVGEWTRQGSPVTYDRETIFDYINGAGEVYRSYAFENVLVAQYRLPAGPALDVELFDMGTAEDAYGVFSYAREQEYRGIGAGYERMGRVLCFWQDRYYVCVSADPGAEEPGDVVEDLARSIAGLLPPAGERPQLVDLLPPGGRVPFSDRFFHTHQSLNYHYYLARENVLHLGTGTDVVLARYEPGPAYLLIIDYGAGDDAARALDSFRAFATPDASGQETGMMAGGGFVSSGRQDRHVVIVLDAPSGPAADELRRAVLERLTGYESQEAADGQG